MRGFPREKWLAVIACAALACGGGGTAPRTCEEDAECASGSRCLQGSCAANAPPVASIALPATIPAYALVSFDGGSSKDADAPLDAISSYAWSFAAVDAPCVAPSSASIAPQAVVRFGCPGRYAVQLTVIDGMGAPSTPATREFDVAATEAPAIQVGPDQTTEHACAGEPLLCTPVDAVALSAAIPDAVGDVTYQWSVEPPAGRPLEASRRVRFEPGPDVANPAVVVESDGTAISGDWIFKVTARDGAGSAGGAAVRVVIGNRAPQIVGKVPAFPHAFDPKLHLFTSSGAIGLTVSDPDGDPILERSAVWRHVGDGDGEFLGVDAGGSLTVDVRVPYRAPEDAQHLIGAGVERSVELAVRDVNGGTAFQQWAVVIGNRPPGAFGIPQVPELPHTYDPATATYLSSGALAQYWIDPDGDPLFQAGPTGDEACPSFTFTRADDGKQTPVVSCAAAFVTLSTLENFAREHLVSVPASDPWEPEASAPTARFTIGDTAPTYLGSSVNLASACTTTTSCCDYDPIERVCNRYSVRHAAAVGTVSGLFEDVDGDPIAVSFQTDGTPSSQLCDGSGEGCAFTVSAPVANACYSTSTNATYTVTANDGANSTSRTLTLKMYCN